MKTESHGDWSDRLSMVANRHVAVRDRDGVLDLWLDGPGCYDISDIRIPLAAIALRGQRWGLLKVGWSNLRWRVRQRVWWWFRKVVP